MVKFDRKLFDEDPYWDFFQRYDEFIDNFEA